MDSKDNGIQTDTEQTMTQTEQKRNAEAKLEKTLSGSIALTVLMAAVTAVVVLVYGFEDSWNMGMSAAAIGLAAIVCGLKWFLEIKNQIRWKRKEEREKARVSDRYDL